MKLFLIRTHKKAAVQKLIKLENRTERLFGGTPRAAVKSA